MIGRLNYLYLLALVVLEVSQVQSTFLSIHEPASNDAASYVWSSEGGRIKLNGIPVDIKGATWFGFQTPTRAPHGLWGRSISYMKMFLDFLAANEFNAMRIPLDLDLMLHDGSPREIENMSTAESEPNMTSLELLDHLILKCADRGIIVLLDLHCLDTAGTDKSPLWFNSEFSEEDAIAGWKKMARRYKSAWNVFAIDVFNEPTGATWGEGKETDMDAFAVKVANAVHAIAPEWLVFVQGTMNSPKCSGLFNNITVICGYGDNLKGVASHPISLAKPDKLVYSPHVYGPSQHNKTEFRDKTFPANMPPIWDDHFGYLKQQTDRAVVVGEWGGEVKGTNVFWYREFLAYLKANDMRDNFIWCINSESSTTGLLIEWHEPDSPKLTMLKRLQPTPTKFTSKISQEFARRQLWSIRHRAPREKKINLEPDAQEIVEPKLPWEFYAHT